VTRKRQSFDNCITANSISVTALGLQRITSGAKLVRRLQCRPHYPSIETGQPIPIIHILNSRYLKSLFLGALFVTSSEIANVRSVKTAFTLSCVSYDCMSKWR
jgi:hypothetical protein